MDLARARTWQEMRDESAALLQRKTGEPVEVWKERIAALAPPDRDSLRAWLAARDVTGYAQNLLVMEHFGFPDWFTADAGSLIDGQYAGREQLRPILDAVIAAAQSFGPVVVQARKGYVSLLTPRRTFAVVRPTTRTRVDLGVRIDDQAPGGRLHDGTSIGASSINLRIPLTSVADLDEDALAWLERAYSFNSG